MSYGNWLIEREEENMQEEPPKHQNISKQQKPKKIQEEQKYPKKSKDDKSIKSHMVNHLCDVQKV